VACIVIVGAKVSGVVGMEVTFNPSTGGTVALIVGKNISVAAGETFPKICNPLAEYIKPPTVNTFIGD
jgi:hypothetical protein